MRQIVLDTETTGINPKEGHRIIEIGCVEMVNRRLTGNNYHVYINPDRIVEEEAIGVHGITNEFLRDKPKFADIAQEFIDYIRGGELVIHNAAFDVGFMDHEFALWQPRTPVVTSDICAIKDTLAIARKEHPGQKNNLDALCKRYHINNSHRTLHGALLDAEILAEVYLMMTGGQTALVLGGTSADGKKVDHDAIRRVDANRKPLKVIQAQADELEQHEEYLNKIEEKVPTLWRN